eukprot:TRINITY_DN27520_c0_g1_i2.p1 TRINITY_DN27520_c0_g1~~TRINITY_DN27520_c0_g1_i2.p1  ORF type:complete len:499 (-),score=75.61 TRINITY_DN27520_c0_g1_i2:134-1630(-)
MLGRAAPRLALVLALLSLQRRCEGALLRRSAEEAAANLHPPDMTEKHCRRIKSGGRLQAYQRRVRKEIHLMTDNEFSKFERAMNLLKQTSRPCSDGSPDEMCASNYPYTWESFVAVHPMLHVKRGDFLFAHRHFLVDLETRLQNLSNDCSVTVPFWNSFAESGHPMKSSIWRPERMGSLNAGIPCESGRRAKDWKCTTTGLGAGWIQDKTAPEGSCDRCVSRRPIDIVKFKSLATVLTQLKTIRRFEDFQGWLETSHIQVHRSIGSDMANIDNSVVDPIFFLHHGMVDMYWAWWQGYQKWKYNERTDRCETCSTNMYFFNERRSTWAGVWRKKKKCIHVPKATPPVCIKFIGHIKGPSESFTERARQAELPSVSDDDSLDDETVPYATDVEWMTPACISVVNKLMSGKCETDDLAKLRLTCEFPLNETKAACHEFWADASRTMRMRMSSDSINEQNHACDYWNDFDARIDHQRSHVKPTSEAEARLCFSCDVPEGWCS